MFNIFKCGYHSKHPKTFEVSYPNGNPCYLLILVMSPCSFRLDTETLTVSANTLFLIRPGVPYRYSGLEAEFVNDWLHFTCDDPDFETECGPLFHRPLQSNNPVQFSQYFQNIVWEHNYADSKYRQKNVSMLLRILLNKLLQEANTPLQHELFDPYALRLQQLRLAMQAQPNKNYSPAELSDSLNVSPSYFQYLYKAFFGIPFKSDLIQMRLDYAKDLIRNTDGKLEQIAMMSGYTNEIHFYRQFKAKMGLTPKAYRQKAKEKRIELLQQSTLFSNPDQ